MRGCPFAIFVAYRLGCGYRAMPLIPAISPCGARGISAFRPLCVRRYHRFTALVFVQWKFLGLLWDLFSWRCLKYHSHPPRIIGTTGTSRCWLGMESTVERCLFFFCLRSSAALPRCESPDSAQLDLLERAFWVRDSFIGCRCCFAEDTANWGHVIVPGMLFKSVRSSGEKVSRKLNSRLVPGMPLHASDFLCLSYSCCCCCDFLFVFFFCLCH